VVLRTFLLLAAAAEVATVVAVLAVISASLVRTLPQEH